MSILLPKGRAEPSGRGAKSDKARTERHEPKSHEQVDDRLVVGLLERSDIDRLRVVSQPYPHRRNAQVSVLRWEGAERRREGRERGREGDEPVSKVDAFDVEG